MSTHICAAAGEGTVVTAGLNKVALYRDADRMLHKRSGICTHLGCAVEWNPADKTFDCICHGAFDEKPDDASCVRQSNTTEGFKQWSCVTRVYPLHLMRA